MRYGLRTFGDIVKAIAEQVKYQTEDKETMARIKRNINTIYLHHIVPASNWEWLNQSTSLSTEPYFEAGDASVQQNVVQVTLTQNIPTSRVGYYFSPNNGNEVYTIATHAAGSNVLTLDTPFNGATNTATKYKIWSDKVILPVNCMNVTEVITTGGRAPLQSVSMQQMRKHQVGGGAYIGPVSYYAEGAAQSPEPYSSVVGLPLVTGRSSRGLVKTIHFNMDISEFLEAGDRIRVLSPSEYTYQGDFPISVVNGNTLSYTGRYALNEAESVDATLVVMQQSVQNLSPVKSLHIYPAMQYQNRRLNLHVDYTAYASELISEIDEPLIPFEHRKILFEGGMWLSLDRNTDPERSETFRALMEQSLQRMITKSETTPNTPSMRTSPSYLITKRRSGRGNAWGGGYNGDGLVMGGGGIGGGFSSSAPVSTGTPNSVAVFDENGYLIGSPDIDLSMLEYLVGNEGGRTENLLPSVTTVVGTYDANEFKSLQFQYQLTRGNSYRSGLLFVNTDGVITTHDDDGPTPIGGNTGVVFDTDIFAGEIRVLAITDGSGATATLKFKTSLL